MLDLVKEYEGMDLITARKAIVEKLEELGNLVKTEEYKNYKAFKASLKKQLCKILLEWTIFLIIVHSGGFLFDYSYILLYTVYKEGDKVLKLENDPDNNVFNGDIGYIKEINDKYPQISIEKAKDAAKDASSGRKNRVMIVSSKVGERR